MTQRGNGGIIGVQNTPTLSAASGVWSVNEVQRASAGSTWPLSLVPDPNFRNVTLLLNGDGTNGAQNNTFIDSSTNNFAITRNGNTTQGTFSPYGDRWSNFFDGSGDWLSTTGFSLGSGAFTIEMWVFMTSYPNAQNAIYSQGTADSGSATTAAVYINSSGTLAIYNFPNSITTTGAVPLNQWCHIAVVRNSGTITLYINGTSSGSGGNGNNISDTTAQIMRGFGGITASPIGYVSNVRVVPGTAVYTANFTPPTAPLTAIANTALLTCQSNRLRDASTNNFTITRNGDVSVQRFSPFSPTAPYAAATIGGSGYFNGASSLTYTQPGSTFPSQVSFLNGATGAGTVECWVYVQGSSQGANTYDFPPVIAVGDTYFSFGVTTANTVRFYWWTGAANNLDSTQTVPFNTWAHIAFVRNGATVTLYVNGVASGSAAYTGWSWASTFNGPVLYVGATSTSGAARFFNGYISNLRVVNGTAVYTANFTPPAAPVTAITNTSLLLNFTNGSIIDGSMQNNLETVGNAQISTSVRRYGTGSLAFDGNGDWLSIPFGPQSRIGSSNLTWEMWINTTSGVQYATLYSRTPSTFASGMWSLMINLASATSGDVALYVGDFNASSPLLMTSGVNVRDGQWRHIAVVRNGSSWVLYVDGVSRSTATWAGSIADLSAPTFIGADQFYGRGYTGNIDDLRITNGVARYTSNFTPPTLPPSGI